MDRASVQMARRLLEERAAGFAEGWRAHAARVRALVDGEPPAEGEFGPAQMSVPALPRRRGPKGWKTPERLAALRRWVPARVPWEEIMRRMAEVSPGVRMPASIESLRRGCVAAGVLRLSPRGRAGSWTQAADDRVRQAVAAGETVRACAAELGKSESAVEKRARRLGLQWLQARREAQGAWLTPARAEVLRRLAVTETPWPRVVERVTAASPDAPPPPDRKSMMRIAARLLRQDGAEVAKRRMGRPVARQGATWGDVLAWAAERDPDGDWVLRGSRAQRLAQVNEVRALEGLKPFVLQEDADARA